MVFYRRKRKTGFRKKRMTYRKKKTYKKKRKYSATLKMVRSIVPDRTFTRLKYTTGTNITSTSVAGYYVFRGNSLFDPDQTGAGSQPFGLDQWANFYNSYRVVASSIKVIARSTQNNNEITMLCIQPRLDTTVDTNYADMAGDSYTRKKMLPNINAGYSCRLGHYMTTRKIFGIPKVTSHDNDFIASTGANPTKQWYWHIVCDDVSSGAVNQNVHIYVEITYYAEFLSRKHLDRS